MTLLPLPWGSGRDRKKGIRARILNLKMRRALEPEFELNHASLS